MVLQGNGMDNIQAIWNARYHELRKCGLTYPGEPWLGNCLGLVPHAETRRALDVGCGSGCNAKYLIGCGYEVTAIDFSEQALEICRSEAPEAHIKRMDLREGIQFGSGRFELVVADLSLHYFSWMVTARVFADIVDALVPGGIFAGRFNSTGDTNYGADSGRPVAGEENLFIVDGVEKRFFTRECFERLLKPPWKAISVEEKTTVRFGPRKVLWEVLAENAANDLAYAGQ